MRKIFRYVSLALLAGLLVSLQTFLPALNDIVKAAEGDMPDGFIQGGGSDAVAVSGNDRFKLDFFPKTGEISVTDLRNQKVWRSNPDGLDSDELAIPQEKSLLKSQLIVYYFSDQALISMDSFGYCVELDQLFYKISGDTLTVHYKIGDNNFSNDQLPLLISQERMERDILAKLDEAEVDSILSRYTLFTTEDADDVIATEYPVVKKHNIYRRKMFPDYIGETIYELFKKAGYTDEDLQKDCDENEIENTYKRSVNFRVEVEYRLTEDGLTARMDPAKIQGSDSNAVVRIDFLPYFGAANATQNGFMFVPDGCGAVINFNNRKTLTDGYEAKLFGRDRTISQWIQSADRAPVTFPVFGASHEDGAFFATIDEGYEVSGIYADVSGKTNSYNNVGCFYEVTDYDVVSMSGKQTADDNVVVTSPQIRSGQFSVTYHLIPSEAAYDEMAVAYRDHLLKQGLIRETPVDNTDMNLEFIGTARIEKSFLGFNYTALKALTTYSEAESILDALGVEHTDVRFSNALEGGKYQKALDKMKAEGVVGNRKSLTALQQKASVTFSAKFREAESASKSRSTRALSKDIVKLYEYGFISRYASIANYSVLLSPSAFLSNASKLLSSMKKQNMDSIHFIDGIASLDSDFNRANMYDRVKMRQEIQNYLETVSGSVKVSANTGSIYSLASLSKIWKFPSSSSGFAIQDETVPFFAVALRGLIPYCTEPINLAAESRTAFLEAVEIGAQLQYSWVYRQEKNITDIYENYYNRQYDSTIEEAKRYADEMSAVSAAIGNSRISSHKRLSESLSETKYENGVTVYVNFAKQQYSAGGLTVEAESFLITDEYGGEN